MKDATIISQLKSEWQLDKEHVYSLKLLRLEHEVVVNYNNYFRMMAGVSQLKSNFAISETTTIQNLTEKVFHFFFFFLK